MINAKATLEVTLETGYESLLEHEVENLFAWTGGKEQAVWVSEAGYRFKLYKGQSLETDPVLQQVIVNARTEGYPGNKADGLKKEIVLLLPLAITVNKKTTNAWYLKKGSTVKWIALDQVPEFPANPSEAGLDS